MRTARYPQKPDIGLACDRGLDDLYTTRNIWPIVCSNNEQDELLRRKLIFPSGNLEVHQLLLDDADELLAVATCDILQICNEPPTAA